MMPPPSSSLSHSVNFSHIKSNGSALLSRPRPCQAGRGEGFFYIAAWTGLTEQPFEQRHENHTDERHTAAGHKLFHPLAFCLCVIKK